MHLSIAVPLYNEEESVGPLFDAIYRSVEPLGIQYEVIFVDDGSSDRTFEVTEELAGEYRQLKVVKFRRNYGQTPAMAAGIDIAKGEIIVTMDGDLQNDPSDIPAFLGKLKEGYDIVVGWRHNRQDKLITRKIPSRIANWLIGKVTGVPIKDNGCSLKAYKRKVIQRIPLYSEMHRFIPAMTSLSGARIAEIKVNHHARQFGESKYGLSRIYKVLMDLLTIKAIVTFGARPLRWFAIISVPFAILGFIYFLLSLIHVASTGSLPLATAGSGVLLLSAVFVLIATGALCELICKTGSIDLNRLAVLTIQRINASKDQA